MRNLTAIFLLIPILACTLSSCGTIVPGTPWTENVEMGPSLMGSQRAKVLRRCAALPSYMSRGPCEEAFVDHRHEKIPTLDIQEKIDTYLKKITALSPWVGEVRKNGTGVTMPYRREAPYIIPYRMHILTISPIVVLVVPKDKNDQFNYCGAPGKQGCLSSPRTGAAFFYRDVIKVAPGTFWFSPDMPVEANYIPNDAKHFEIRLPDSKIELVAKDGVWDIQRNVLNK